MCEFPPHQTPVAEDPRTAWRSRARAGAAHNLKVRAAWLHLLDSAPTMSESPGLPALSTIGTVTRPAALVVTVRALPPLTTTAPLGVKRRSTSLTLPGEREIVIALFPTTNRSGPWILSEQPWRCTSPSSCFEQPVNNAIAKTVISPTIVTGLMENALKYVFIVRLPFDLYS
ncbi:hypothetical protein SAMN05421690_101377 [Nitrosomonas sp. Nm51]|nr:hypothetical protein SAMN05421690_101377 [Nitrosomonas sp. Nm51]